MRPLPATFPRFAHPAISPGATRRRTFDKRVVRAWLAAESAWREYFQVITVIGLITLAGWFAPFSSYRAFGHVYLLAVVILCLRVGPWPILFAAVVSALAWNYVLMPPRLSFSVLHFEDVLTLGTYFVVALIASQLIGRIRAQERAAESDRLARTLLDSVSHELKTPLAVLRSTSENLLADDGARCGILAREIRTATLRLDRLIGNLLQQTRLNAGVIKPRLEPCDVRDLIAAARRTVGEPLGARAVTIEVPADLPFVAVDAPLIEQAIANLLLNAALYTPPDTPITVTAGPIPRGAGVFIAVSDRGPGIPAEIRSDLFGKFRRGREARAGGVGLGLSIVRGFVRAHGGDVVLDDNPGGGARFTLALPVTRAEPAPDE